MSEQEQGQQGEADKEPTAYDVVGGAERLKALVDRFYVLMDSEPEFAVIRRLHPALDEWMIVEGYGKVLSRPGLDLPRRELCIIAACIAARQDRQLHSHLHGAVNAGAAPATVDAALVAVRDVVPDGAIVSATLLWNRVKGK